MADYSVKDLPGVLRKTERQMLSVYSKGKGLEIGFQSHRSVLFNHKGLLATHRLC